MSATGVIHDLALVMLVAAGVSFLFVRLQLPPLLGYVLAGILLGPYTFSSPPIDDPRSVRSLAELGMVLLLFSLGIELSLARLRKAGLAAVIAAILQILLCGWLGYELALLFRWSGTEGLVLGAALALSSTRFGLHVVRQRGGSRELEDLLAGILVIENLLALVMITLFSGAAAAEVPELVAVLEAAGRLALFVIAALVIGFLAVPRILAVVVRLQRNEILLLVVLGLVFGFALLANKLGFGLAPGAFVMGSILAGSRHRTRVDLVTAPLRDMFSAIFFVTVGMMLDPFLIVDNGLAIVAIAATVLVAKTLSYSFGALAGGRDLSTAVRGALGMAQIGGLAVLVAFVGLEAGATRPFLFAVIVIVAVLTSALSPYLFRAGPPIVAWLYRVLPQRLTEVLDEHAGHLRGAPAPRHSTGRRHLRRLVIQILINVALVIAVFVAAGLFADAMPEWFTTPQGEKHPLRSLLWLGGALLTLPVFLDLYRKLQVLGMIVSALSIDHRGKTRTVVANSILVAGIIALALLTLLVSAPLLPRWNVVVVLLAMMIFVGWLLRRSFIRLYTRAEVAVEEQLESQPERAPETERALRSLFEGAELDTVAIDPRSVAAGRRVRELDLRARTGASAVGIERAGEVILNPGPDEVFEAGDRVLLLGDHHQIAAAREFLTPKASSERGAA